MPCFLLESSVLVHNVHTPIPEFIDPLVDASVTEDGHGVADLEGMFDFTKCPAQFDTEENIDTLLQMRGQLHNSLHDAQMVVLEEGQISQ